VSQYIPVLPHGNDAQAAWFRWATESLTRLLRISPGPGHLPFYTTRGNGTVVRSQYQVRTTGAGITFEGEYSATPGDYSENMLVVISAGSNSGTYLCLASPATTDPWEGAPDWVKFPPGNYAAPWT